MIAERRSEAGAFRYSNAGYVLLGAAIEAASGLSYDEYISLLEQPAYKRVREYISVIGRTVYLTFPFTRDEDFPKVWEEYLVIRRRQLDELFAQERAAREARPGSKGWQAATEQEHKP